MKIVFIGSGSAFTVGNNNFHSNIMLIDGDNKLLIDCGSDARLSLHALSMSYKDIKEVYISHLHADHVGGLEWLAFTTKLDPECVKPKLHICETMVEKLWDHVLSGGLGSFDGEATTLSTFFDVEPVPQNGSFLWRNIRFQLMQTEHVTNTNEKVPSYGLYFIVDNLRCLITTDTQLSPHLQEFHDKSDIIFQDCETAGIKRTGHAVHAHYTDLVELKPEIKSKMWLYHYNPGPLPDAKSDGFCGFVKRGQMFQIVDGKVLIE